MMDDSKIETVTPATPAAGDAAQQTAEPQAQDAAQQTAQDGAQAPEVDFGALVAELEAALAEERARAEKLVDQTQRMAAEFQNSRRRQENQLNDEIDRAAGHLIKRLLPVIDDFDLAFAHVPAELEGGAAWVEGFRQIQKKLHNILGEEGVVVIPGEGEFDPALHEAVTAEPSDTVPSGHLIATLRAGYTYKGKVLRPALVRVAT